MKEKTLKPNTEIVNSQKQEHWFVGLNEWMNDVYLHLWA